MGQENTSEGPKVAILFFGVSLAIGIVCRQMLHRTRVPYTVAIFLAGFGLGWIEYGTSHGLGKLGTSIRLWSSIDPDLLLFIFLPPLLFESTLSMDAHQVKKSLAQMVLLAGPGVVISTFSIGIVIHFLFPFGWDWTTSFLLGGLLSATDPVAVVAFLKELGVSRKLSTIIEGESMINDGVSIVIFRLLFQMVLGQTFSVTKSIKFLSKVSFGSIALGLLYGILSIAWLGFTRNDVMTELTLTCAVSYIAYFCADDGLDLSGILTVVTFGMLFSALAKLSFNCERQHIMHNFWEMIAYVANTLVFIISGTIIAEIIHQSLINIQGHVWGYVFLLYAFVQISRGIVVGVLYPGLIYFGYGLCWKEAIIIMWSGLRGVVALSMSLSVHHTSARKISNELTKETGALFVFFTSGVVFLTLVLNGTTTQLLLHLLRIQKITVAKEQIIGYARFKMKNNILEALQRSENDEELGQADLTSITSYISCLNDSHEQLQTHLYHLSFDEDKLHRIHVQDMRLRLLSGVRSSYYKMLEEEKITKAAAIILLHSVDEASDMARSDKTLNDWEVLSSYACFPDYYKYLQIWFLPRKLVTLLSVKKLELGCYICAAFLQSHTTACRQLHDFVGESIIVDEIIKESEAERESAKQFLEDVHLSFPQVQSAVKTKQLTHGTLLELIHYVQDLEKVGLVNEIETNELQNAVKTELQKLRQNSPSMEMPKINDMLVRQPLLRRLPSKVQETLGNSAKLVMKPRGSILYKENSKPDGIWLIVNGLVKVESNIRDVAHGHPTFSCGSALGLYEALTGKPRLCRLTAESAVHCFFIETNIVVSSIESEPEIEDLFWKESAFVVTKLVLPHQFEGISLEGLQDSLCEQSTMRILLRDEVIEFQPHYVTILMEGHVRGIGETTPVTSPALLIPSNAKHRHTTSGINGSTFWFEAMTRSRVFSFHFNLVNNNQHGFQRALVHFSERTYDDSERSRSFSI